MNISLLIFVMMAVMCYGDYPTPILDAIINGASKIRSRIQNAGTFIDKIAHRQSGSLNFGGSIDINKDNEHHPPPGYGSHGYGPGPGPMDYNINTNNHNNNYQPGFPMRPESNQPGYNNGPSNKPWQNYNYNTQNQNQNEFYNSEDTSQENKHSHGNTNYNKKPSDDGQTLYYGPKKEDGPTRIPLNPNEVNYGADKTENNSPKRETKNEEADDDQEYNIDVRFNNND